MIRHLYTILILLSLILTSRIEGQVVGWRGDGTGCYPQATPPVTWSVDEDVVWKTELSGTSPASAVLVADRIFVLSDPALLICVRSTDGEVLWKRSHTAEAIGGAAGTQVVADAGTHNPDGHAGSAASTVVSDGRTVIAMFANGVVSAHDLDGNRKWIRFVEAPELPYGHSASPAVADGHVLIQFRDLVALDLGTGEERWRVSLPASHGSPVVTRIGDCGIVVHPRGCILRARDGKVLADSLFDLGESSPVVQDGVIYANENGTLKAVSLSASTGDELKAVPLWTCPSSRGQYQIASPVVHDGHVYSVSLTGIIQATNCRTGEQVFQHRLPVSSRVYTSIQFAGGRLYVADQTGTTVVLNPGPEYSEAAVNALDFHPTCIAFADSRIFVRTYQHLYCIGAK